MDKGVLTPPEISQGFIDIGVKKVNQSAIKLLLLGILAGAFIAFAAEGSNVAVHTIPSVGLAKALAGALFSTGLMMVLVAGAELFTGNNLIVMACANRRVSLGKLLRNWGLVYLGNLIGSLAMAALMFWSRQYTFANGALGANALAVANAKTGLVFGQALALGVLCNMLVCLAVWLCYSARSTADKVLAIIFPITAFVAAGFEHSVANMYLIPIGLLIKHFDPAFASQAGVSVANLTVGNMLLANLLPVTIGNVIGGAGLVGLVYWSIYLRPQRAQEVPQAPAARDEEREALHPTLELAIQSER